MDVLNTGAAEIRQLVDTVTVLSEDRSHVRLYDGMSSNKN
mgnify:CR=1 FL=1